MDLAEKVFKFRFRASISSHNPIFYDKQTQHADNTRLLKVSCLNFRIFRTHALLDLMDYLLFFMMNSFF